MGRTKNMFEDMRLQQQDFFYKKINYEAELEYQQFENCDNRLLDTRVGG
jgi:hypothetical protein|tara:strand:+ start:665 stop:811 length:147 start_codon:yes stop_codon:yes gene_type:complete